jgi:hypothetical protein
MKNRCLGLAVLVALSALVGLVPATSEAVPVLVTSRAGLGGTDHYDWGALGGDFTFVPSPFSIASVGATSTATVTNPSDGFERRDQGTGWAGNFAPGDRLLWTRNTAGPMQIDFSSPVSAAGAQIQADVFGAFVGFIDVFDGSDSFLTTFSLAGLSGFTSDNSAIFLGVRDSNGIGRIDYRIAGAGDFAINQLDVDAAGTPIPEPGTLMLIGSGLAGLALRNRRKI